MSKLSRRHAYVWTSTIVAGVFTCGAMGAESTQSMSFSETVIIPAAAGRVDQPFTLSMPFEQLDPLAAQLDEVVFEYRFELLTTLTIPAGSGGGGSGSLGGSFLVNGVVFGGDGGGGGNGGGGPIVLTVPFFVPFSSDGSGIGSITIDALTNPDALAQFAGTGTATIVWDAPAVTTFDPPDGGMTELALLATSYVKLTYRYTVLCPTPFADTDDDGDVDQVDFGTWQLCYTGGAVPMPADNTCFCLDRNQNQAVDAEDLDAFLLCVSGPSIPASEDCTGQ